MSFLDTMREILQTEAVPPCDLPDGKGTPSIGQVVLVESMAGQRVLVVVVGVWEDRPQMPLGRWLGVTDHNGSRWLRDSLVVDWQPRCGTCGSQCWCWTHEAMLFCATCHPPNPNWRQGFEQLADWTHGILPDDPRLPAVLAAIDECDQSWWSCDWPRFQACALRVRWAVPPSDRGA